MRVLTVWRKPAIVALLAVSTLGLTGTGAAADRPEAGHCVSPVGEDLNETWGTEDALITPFCSSAVVGQHWRPLTRVAAAGSEPVFPVGYSPVTDQLTDDFLHKLVSGRYVVDAGGKHERSYTVDADDFAIEEGVLPDGSVYVRWAPRFHPLPPGDHTVDTFVTLSSDMWDGLGTDPSLHLIPGGESFVGTLSFTVARPSQFR
jgi:hypothetical protein